LHSQFSRRAIESLRFASGDEALRSQIYDKFGEVVFENFVKVKPEVEKWIANDGAQEGDEEEGGTLRGKISEKKRKKLLNPDTWSRDIHLYDVATQLQKKIGDRLYTDHNEFRCVVEDELGRSRMRLSVSEKKIILKTMSWRVEEAPPVIAKTHKHSKADPLHGLIGVSIGGKPMVVEYEPDTDLRDTEQVPFLEEGGIEGFITREVLPYVADAWIKDDATKIGYEINFNRYFHKPQLQRSLEKIRKDILVIEKETAGLLDDILGA
jgi:type I restriction enzyme M protein